MKLELGGWWDVRYGECEVGGVEDIGFCASECED